MNEQPRRVEMTDPVAISIDGKEVEVQRGELLIDACERNGTYIPRFCYHPRMEPVGMCRMCLVEVDAGRGPALLPSCMVECAPDMAVDTRSDAVHKAQDGVLEFLLINHPLDCPVCDKGGECPLQDQTMAYGPGESRWTEEKRHYAKPIPISETVYLDRERCILCDRCTRFASEVAGDPLIHFMDRGASTQVNTFPDEPFASYFSGNTVQICPVGALTAKPYRFKARPWDLSQAESTCTTCSVGCRITVQSSRNEVLRYQGVDSDPVNWGWLCDKGRFGFEAVNSDERLAEPLRREGEELRPARWSEALTAATDAIRAALDGPRGAAGVAVLGGSRLTNESAYAWAKLAKGVVGTDHVDAQLGDGLPAEVVLGMPAATIDDVCRPGGTVLYLGPDPKEELPVLFLRLRHAATRDGVRIVELAPAPTGLTPYAAASVRHRPGEAAELLRRLFDGGAVDDPAAGRAAELLAGADAPTMVLGRPSVAEPAERVVDALAVVTARRPGVRVLPALRRGNVRGALEMGLSPGWLPGRVPLGEPGAYAATWPSLPADPGLDAQGILRAAADGAIDTLVLVGADPLADFPDRTLAERALLGVRHLVAVDCFLHESARRAGVVLAAAGFAEVDGTTTNLEGRVSTVARTVTPPGTARPDWLIAADLAHRLGADLGADDAAALWAEIESLAPAMSGVTGELLASSGHADGVVVPREPGAAELVGPPVLEEGPNPPTDAYSVRLATPRSLYDAGTQLARCPSSAGLARDAVTLLHPSELERLGLPGGGRVRVTGNDRSFLVDARPEPGMARGTIVIGWGDPGVPVGNLIDAAAPTVEVRLEVAD